MRFFEGLITETEVKQKYKELAKAYHPDLGGCAETMKQINAQYETCLKGHYQNSGMQDDKIDEILATEKALSKKILEILHLEGLNVEICGLWIWITGNTREHKISLKNCGFLWSSKKEAWYWREENKKGGWYRKSEYELSAIRMKHGSLTVQKKERVALV